MLQRPLKIRVGLGLFVLSVVALAACQQDEITVVRIPKENTAAAVSVQSGHREVDWQVPSGWTEKAPSQMRVGSFSVNSATPDEVDVSVISLSGMAGGDLANVNRWRGQLNLDPVDASELSDIMETVSAGPHSVRLVFFANKTGQAMLAGMVEHNTSTWFFKATGPAKAVKKIQPSFLAFISSARFHDHE